MHELKSVLAWSPKDVAAHYDLAKALKASGQTEDAERELRVAHELEPAAEPSQ